MAELKDTRWTLRVAEPADRVVRAAATASQRNLTDFVVGAAVSEAERILRRGYNYTIGFDAFGLPNENAAMEEDCTPQELVERNIAAMRAEFRRLG